MELKDKNWYFTFTNFKNQDLIFETFECLEDQDLGDIEPIIVVNVVHECLEDFFLNFDKPFDVLDKMKQLELSENEYFLLVGLVAKWMGVQWDGQYENSILQTPLRLLNKEIDLLTNENNVGFKPFFLNKCLYKEIVRSKDTDNPVESIEIVKKTTPVEIHNNSEIKPIIWTSEAVLLGYLVQWLKENKFISNKSKRDELIFNHFTDDSGNKIKHIKQGLSRSNKNNDGGVPRNYDKLEPLLKTLPEIRKFLEEK